MEHDLTFLNIFRFIKYLSYVYILFGFILLLESSCIVVSFICFGCVGTENVNDLCCVLFSFLIRLFHNFIRV